MGSGAQARPAPGSHHESLVSDTTTHLYPDDSGSAQKPSAAPGKVGIAFSELWIGALPEPFPALRKAPGCSPCPTQVTAIAICSEMHCRSENNSNALCPQDRTGFANSLWLQPSSPQFPPQLRFGCVHASGCSHSTAGKVRRHLPKPQWPTAVISLREIFIRKYEAAAKETKREAFE